jgi:hypothetical protein
VASLFGWPGEVSMSGKFFDLTPAFQDEKRPPLPKSEGEGGKKSMNNPD